MSARQLVTFDWAMKRILRDKANFGVLEGFLSELLGENIKIQNILESESNQEYKDDKFNRIDVKAVSSKGEIIIIAVQYETEYRFFQKIAYSISKTICQHISMGEGYENIAKVISVNILHYNIGDCDDYIYKGATNFVGIHTNNEPKLSDSFQKTYFGKSPLRYFYLLLVGNFDKHAETPLDQWIHFLKTGEIEDNFKAKGIEQAKSTLDIMRLSRAERVAFDRHIDNLRYEKDVLNSAHTDGVAEGREEGRKEGIAHRNKELAQILLRDNVYDVQKIAEITNLSIEEIERLKAKSS